MLATLGLLIVFGFMVLIMTKKSVAIYCVGLGTVIGGDCCWGDEYRRH